jgi:tRNA-2-methylthio-N6-dimethylallyladenosine synthase
MKRKYYVETYGCQMNAYDSQVIEGFLDDDGLERVDRPEDSDLIIFNTCSVRDNAEQRVLGRINQLQQLRKGREEPLLMGVVGCMAQRLGEQIEAVTRKRIDFAVGPDQYRRLPEIIAAAGAEGRDLYYTDFDQTVTYQARPKQSPPGGTHFVAVMRGCDKYCSYCIVPFTRGRERSKDWREIVAEVEHLASENAFELTLLGQTISSYRHEDVDFAGLLEKVSAVDGIVSIRFMTSYPTDMTPELFRAIAALPKVGRAIHLPVQSGSDRMLKAMNRRYTVAQYEEILAAGRREIPNLLFSTDLIVGYPGETEADFQHTLDLVNRQGFISAFSFKYSPREGTLSARQPDDVPQAVKEERLARLLALQEAETRKHLESMLGTEQEILLDETSKKQETHLRGRTRQNIRIIVKRRPELKIGTKVGVHVHEIAGSSLRGQLLEPSGG